MRFVNPGVFQLGKIFGPLLGAFLLYHFLFWGRIFPGVKVADLDISGKTPQQAVALLNQEIVAPPELALVADQKSFNLILAEIKLTFDFEKTAKSAFDLGRRQDWLANFKEKVRLLAGDSPLPLVFSFNEGALNQFIAQAGGQLSVSAVEPKVTLSQGKVSVNPGENGQELDARATKELILQNLATGNFSQAELPVRQLSSRLSEEEVKILETKAKSLVGKNLVLKFEFDTFSYNDAKLVELLTPGGSFDGLKITALVGDIANKLNRGPQDALFVFKEGKVQQFASAKDGIKVGEDELAQKIETGIEDLAADEEKTVSLQVPFLATKPKVTLDQVNNLGIKELIGRGSSRFRGSIASRIHNIGVASSRISGTLVAPGEVFSFNLALGDVSAFTGYEQAYIIKDGRTILGDGGGVCQVSSTLFRAMLSAGLPVLERHQHSYRVSYYEQDSKPGFDATVYSPSVDLRFKNDTPAHLLIQAIFDAKNATLVFEIYGASDGRTAITSNHRIWDQVPAPAPLYQDDPSLPAGKTKQVDFAAAGAKVAFDYKVVRGTEVLQDRTFYSNFRPWQAVFLRGTGPVQ